MWPDNLELDVSRESLLQLEAYQALLFKWQKAINLVGNKTLQESGVRHFADSAQLAAFIPSNASFVMDWGSGAGFPGAVLSILRPDLDYVLVESDERKCQFLKAVSRETSATMRVENARIEDVADSIDKCPDLITARALKSVKVLLDFAAPLFAKNTDLKMLLLKGEAVDEEIADALTSYAFDFEKHASITNPLGCVLLLSNIRTK